MKKLHTLMLSVGLLAGAAANAQLKIEIAGVGSNQIPIAIAAFADESMAPAQVSAIIKADLERSGVFKIIDAGTMSENDPVSHSQWKSRGADALVVGSVQKLADGRFEVRYKLHDTVKTMQPENEVRARHILVEQEDDSPGGLPGGSPGALPGGPGV